MWASRCSQLFSSLSSPHFVVLSPMVVVVAVVVVAVVVVSVVAVAVFVRV